MIRPWRDGDAAGWDAYVRAHPAARCCHLSAWKRIIEGSFGHDTPYLVAEDGSGRIRGILPAVRLRSRLFGDFLVSVPYLNYGGPCADDDATWRELMAAGAKLAAGVGAQHLEVRTETAADAGLAVRSTKVSMRLHLPASAELLWKAFPAKLRSQVKRAQQATMTVRVGRADQLGGFYRVFAENMRDLGTPVYGKRFFDAVLRELPDTSWICCVYAGDTPVAAGFLMAFGNMLEIPWASSLRRFNRLSPNMLLYWSVLEFACQRGFAVFDFGRSSPDSGTYKFKAQWGAAAVPLYWHYWVPEGSALPNLTPQNPKMQLAIRAWQHLPVRLTTLIGPSIVKNLP
jgi:FemAB-related protein (PEP-CTERM system-associated)